MGSSKRKTSPGKWFDRFPPIDPPGWDDTQGWCRRHWAPLAQIPDPAQRADAQRLASLDLMGVFAAALRRKVAPLPVPAHHLAAIVRKLAPVCCYVGDGNMQGLVLAAMLTVSAGEPVAIVMIPMIQPGKGSTAAQPDSTVVHPVTEYGVVTPGGTIRIRNALRNPEVDRIYPLTDWLAGLAADGQVTFQRTILVIDDWGPVTP